MRRAFTTAVALTAIASVGAGAPSRATSKANFEAPSGRISAGEGLPSNPTANSRGLAGYASLCPRGTLPDGEACVHLPDDDEDAPEAQSATSAHHDVNGRWIVYDQIPRRPERTADYDAYRYPVACSAGCVMSGYDLDRPDETQRRTKRRIGHGAIDITARRGMPVAVIVLEHQYGDAEVIYVGPLFGTTVVTRHTVREGGDVRDYVVLYGHLDAVASGLIEHVGRTLSGGEIVGFVGDTGSVGLVHLHLETRRVREGIDAARLAPWSLVDNASTVVCDPRNVLPLK